MTFLTSRREKPKDSSKGSYIGLSDKKKRRKSTKAADTEAEISRYFMSAEHTSLDTTTSLGQNNQQDRRRSQDHESLQACVDLPDRPFLGFGSCGPNTSISPAKIHVNRRGDSRCATRSTSYLTWSQSGRSSYASPSPDRRHRVEPARSSTLFNRKRTSPAPHRSQHSIPSVSPSCIQTTSSKTQGTASRPSSKHENTDEAPGQGNDSQLATGERPRSREKSQKHADTGNIELDAANIPQAIEDSVLNNTHPVEVATHDIPEPALSPRNQAAYQSSGYEPQCEPQAHDMGSLSAQMPIISPHKDPLDDILEALLRDCNTNVAGSDSASHATSSHHNLDVSEEAVILNKGREHSRMPARAFVSSVYAPDAPASASNSSREPRSAIHQHASAHDGSRSTYTLSRGSVNSSHRPSLAHTRCARGYPAIPTQSHVDSRNAWNGYDTLYERQQEQANPTPETSRELIPPNTAVRDDLSDPWRETGHAAGPEEYTQDLRTVEAGDKHNGYRPYLYKTLQERNENGNDQEIRHGEWDDELVDYGASYGSGASLFHESHKGCDNGIMVEWSVNKYQQGEISADPERSFAQWTDQYEIEDQPFTKNIPETYSSWRLHHMFGRKDHLERCAADAQVHDVDPALSEFWTPHKLY